MKAFKSILEFQKHFNTDDKCRQFLEYQRWGKNPACPFCGSLHVKRLKNGKRFQCNEKLCRKQFSATVGTVAENTKIPLTKWFLAMYILSNHSKGISSLQLASWLGISQKSAWHLNHRIRLMLTERAPELLENIVEVDETYVGGKVGNQHRRNKNRNNKTMVFGALQRDGKVVTKIIQDTKGDSLVNAVEETIQEGAIMVTDELAGYNKLNKKYKHVSVNHEVGQYVRDLAHTNTIEGYWSQLKRQIIGIHHYVSPKHLQRYCNEVSFRYNFKGVEQDERFACALFNIEGSLKYKDLIK